MNKDSKDQWLGLRKTARDSLVPRNYIQGSLADRVSGPGLAAADLIANVSKADRAEVWIPGVEIFPRNIHHQRHRGLFGEFARESEGILGRIALWPKQWSAARMYAQTAKGFHIHPPSIPDDTPAADWHRRLFESEPENYTLRRYEHEQWDVMFFVQGRIEMLLRDAREGLPARTMHFYIDGDNHPGASNVAVIIPPGVAHALRVEGSEDAVMVYGTTTTFSAESEGRIGSDVETAALPQSWQKFLQTD